MTGGASRLRLFSHPLQLGAFAGERMAENFHSLGFDHRDPAMVKRKL